jgi:hypothetical protein
VGTVIRNSRILEKNGTTDGSRGDREPREATGEGEGSGAGGGAAVGCVASCVCMPAKMGHYAAASRTVVCFSGNGRTMARRSWARGKLRKMRVRPRVRWADSFARDRPSVQQPARPQPFWDHARDGARAAGRKEAGDGTLSGLQTAWFHPLSATVAAKLPATSP